MNTKKVLPFFVAALVALLIICLSIYYKQTMVLMLLIFTAPAFGFSAIACGWKIESHWKFS